MPSKATPCLICLTVNLNEHRSPNGALVSVNRGYTTLRKSFTLLTRRSVLPFPKGQAFKNPQHGCSTIFFKMYYLRLIAVVGELLVDALYDDPPLENASSK